MKVIITDAIEVAPKEGTIIRFEDRGLVVIGIYVGHSDNGNKWLYEGSVAPVKYDDEWNTSDEETDDSTWIGEFDLRATYGVGFVESLPDIANGEMTEIRIKYTAEKCE